MKKKSAVFGAITDDPTAIANRAIREAEKAIREDDALGVRQAANKGWLAAASVADVVADRMGQSIPHGATGRLHVLNDLERRTRMRRGTLTAPFGTARQILHGGCFHGAVCPSPGEILGHLDEIKDMTIEAKRAMAKLPKRKKGC